MTIMLKGAGNIARTVTFIAGIATGVAILVGCATSPVQDRLRNVQSLNASGRTQEAHALLRQTRADFPRDAEVVIAYDQANTWLTKLLGQAENAKSKGQWDEAERFYKQALATGWANEQANKGLAEVEAGRAGVKKVASPAPSNVPLSVWEPRVVSALEDPPAKALPPKPAAAPTKKATNSAATSSKPAPSAETLPARPPTSPVVGLSSNPASNPPVSADEQPKLNAGKPVEKLDGPALVLTSAAPIVPPTPAQTPIVQAMQKRLSLQFRDASVRSLFDIIAKTSGLNVIIDKDVQPDLKTTVFLNNTTIESAIKKILMTTQLAYRELDDNTILVYPDVVGKQQDYQALVVRSFHLGNADAKVVANSLKTVLKFKDIVIDEKLNMIVLRDTPEAIRLAEKLVALHDVPEAEVMLDVEVAEISRSLLKNLGIDWPAQLSLSPLPIQLQDPGATTFNKDAQLTLRDLWNLTPGRTAASIGSMTIKAHTNDGDVNTLANPRIRVRNREKAKILIGQRVPNITATSTSTGFVSENINYVDVGLKLEVEPQIYADKEVVIKISLEVSNIIEAVPTKSGTIAYRLGTRTAATVLRLKDGENQILAGLIQDEDRRTGSKVPGLGDIPIIGRLFGTQQDDKQKTEIVLSITPRLIRSITRPTKDIGEFDAGTISSVRGRRGEGVGEVVPVNQPDEIPQTRTQPSRTDQPQPQPNSPSPRSSD